MALAEIRERILRGDYAEGMALRQDAIATELGVSRIPVREALRQLEVEGFVTLSPHQGATVSTLSTDEIREIFELRALIESDLLRRSIPNLTGEELDLAGEILDEYDAALQDHEVARWGTLNWEFHKTLLAGARRPMALGIVESLNQQSERYTRLQLSLTKSGKKATDEHRALLSAVRDKEIGLATALLMAHISGAGKSLVEFLRAHRDEAPS